MIVHVYSQPACGPCRRTKKLMDELGIEYLDHNIIEDDAAREFVIDGLGAAVTPVVAVFADPVYGDGIDDVSIAVVDHWQDHRPDKIRALQKEDA